MENLEEIKSIIILKEDQLKFLNNSLRRTMYFTAKLIRETEEALTETVEDIADLIVEKFIDEREKISQERDKIFKQKSQVVIEYKSLLFTLRSKQYGRNYTPELHLEFIKKDNAKITWL